MSSCGKCGAGPANIEHTSQYLQSGAKLFVSRCLLCGWMDSRPAPAAQVADRRDVPAEKPKKQPPQAQPNKNRFPQRECTHVNCKDMYSVCARTRFNLCPTHSIKMWNWVKRGMRTPPPYLQQNGVWIDNPEFKSRKRSAA